MPLYQTHLTLHGGHGYGSFPGAQTPVSECSSQSSVVHLDLRAVSAKLRVPEAVLARSLGESSDRGLDFLGPPFRHRLLGSSAPMAQHPPPSAAMSHTPAWICPVMPSPGNSFSTLAMAHDKRAESPSPPHAFLRPPPSVIIVGSPDQTPAPRLFQVRGPYPKVSAQWVECPETAVGRPPQDRVFLTLSYVRPLQAWAALLVGLFGWSASGPLYSTLPLALQQRPCRVALWRYAGGFLPFALLSLWQYGRHGISFEQRRRLASPASWPSLSLLALTTFAGFFFFGRSVALCPEFALAVGVSVLNPFLLLVWDLLVGRPLGVLSLIGLALASLGLLGLLSADRLQSSPGILCGVLASACFTVYVAAADVLRPKLPFSILMALTFGVGTLVAAAATAFEGSTLDTGPESLFGFLEDWNVLGTVCCMVGCYVMGLAGLTGCANALPPMVVAVAIALEPVMSVGLGVLGGQAAPPPLMAVGLTTIVLGSIVVGVDASMAPAEQRVDVTDAAVSVPAAITELL